MPFSCSRAFSGYSLETQRGFKVTTRRKEPYGTGTGGLNRME
jgi:hypothetical protein